MATGVRPLVAPAPAADQLDPLSGVADRLDLFRSLGTDGTSAGGSWYRDHVPEKLSDDNAFPGIMPRTSRDASTRPASPMPRTRRPPSSNHSDGGVYRLRNASDLLLARDPDAPESMDWHPLSDDDQSLGSIGAAGSDDADLVGSPLAVGRWEDLPDGILREITRHMAPSYLRVMRLVCRSWADFAGRHTSSLKPEKVDGPRLAARFPHLRSLDLSHCQHMVVHSKQNELRLQSSLTDAALRYLEPLRSLRTLSLRGCNTIEGPGLRHIVALTNLRSLDLTGCVRLTNKGLEHVASLANLAHLNLRECRLITNDGLRRLEPLVHLKHFSMSNCTSVSDRGLQSLAKLVGLETINISRCNYVTDRGLSALLLSPLPALRRIVVRKCPGVTEDGLREIAALKAKNDGCQLELPPPMPAARHSNNGLFVDAWLNQGFQPIDQGVQPGGHNNNAAGAPQPQPQPQPGTNNAHLGALAPLDLHHN